MSSSRSKVPNYFTRCYYVKPYDSVVREELPFHCESFGVHNGSKSLIKSEVMIANKD